MIKVCGKMITHTLDRLQKKFRNFITNFGEMVPLYVVILVVFGWPFTKWYIFSFDFKHVSD